MGFCALDLGSFRSGSSRIDLDRFLLGAIGLVDGVGYSGAVDDGLFRFRSDRGLSGGSGRIRSDEFRSDGSGGDGVLGDFFDLGFDGIDLGAVNLDSRAVLHGSGVGFDWLHLVHDGGLHCDDGEAIRKWRTSAGRRRGP